MVSSVGSERPVVYWGAIVRIGSIACAALAAVLSAAATARAQPTPAPQNESASPAKVRRDWLQLGLGMSLPVPRSGRNDGGLDIGAAYGFRHGPFRFGGEARYTFVGGFDAPKPIYRMDIGPAAYVELVKLGSASLQLGIRLQFTRSGTYRRADIPIEPDACEADDCPEGGDARVASFMAYYGLSSSFDVALVLPYWFVRISGVHTGWHGSREANPPYMEHWFQLATGFAR